MFLSQQSDVNERTVMRTEITESEHLLAHSGDLAEMFETFIQQRAYLEVCAVASHDSKHTIVGHLREFDVSGFFNMSFWFSQVARENTQNGYTYESTIADEQGEIRHRYFAYETKEDAIAHVTELLSDISTTI